MATGHVPRVVVVTGATRGIGREVVAQLAARGDTAVIATRSLSEAGRTASGIRASRPRGRVMVAQLDVTDPTAADRLARELADVHGRLDGLVNGADVHYDSWQHAMTADLVTVREALETNLIGAWRTTLALLPLLQGGAGRVVNLSSAAGSLATMGPGIPAYRVSKAALNALTRTLAAELRDTGVLVNSVCPAWHPDDGPADADQTAAHAAAGVLWALDLPSDGPTGGFFCDGHPIPW